MTSLVAVYRESGTEVHRHRFYTTRPCAHCGRQLRTPSGTNTYQYKYVLVPGGDRGQARVLPGLVCSSECHLAHHREELSGELSQKSA